MSEHFGLLTEFDAPVLFNTVKPYAGDSDTATSPSLWCLHEWERLAVDAASPALCHDDSAWGISHVALACAQT